MVVGVQLLVFISMQEPLISIDIPMAIMIELFFATYSELILLTKAWKMHSPLSCILANTGILIALASNSARHVAMDLMRQPEQLSCYCLLHAISSVYYLQLI